MNVINPFHIQAAALALALAACNHETPLRADDGADPDAGRYHENSFSWTQSEGALARPAAVSALDALETEFTDGEAFVAAMKALEQRLEDPEFSRSLWKPLDHACDELELALWNTYGTVRVAGNTVLDASILRSRCMHVGDDGDALAKSAAAHPSEVTDRQYPYKMIGRSWDNFTIPYLYTSTGAETQFKKHREKLWTTAWWDTDASRIGVRIHLYDCTTTSPKECTYHGSKSDWYKNDDYVSKREMAVAIRIQKKVLKDGKWVDWYPGQAVYYPTDYIKDFRIADAVIGFHSVNHAGRTFRAVSSSGFGSGYPHDLPVYNDFVEW